VWTETAKDVEGICKESPLNGCCRRHHRRHFISFFECVTQFFCQSYLIVINYTAVLLCDRLKCRSADIIRII
jgi:hypothetical protein